MVLLQHPRERRVAFGTARMTHLALTNSELHVGLDFERHPRLRALAGEPEGSTVLLFPSPDAWAPDALPWGPPRTLIVVDGTWVQAAKMLARNPLLGSLPRVGLAPARPGNYRIRREPAPHCLATVEAVAEVLAVFERDPGRFEPLRTAFERMVDQQIVHKTARRNPYHRQRRRLQPRSDPMALELRARRPDLVVVHGEANAHPSNGRIPGPAELIQLLALRVVTGERFAATIAPRRPLAVAAPAHLEIDRAEILAGEAIASTMARWRGFVRPADVFCTWGKYTLDLLRAEGGAERPLLDLREATTRRLGRRAGGIEPAAELLERGGVCMARWAPGRGGRRIALLAGIVEALSA